jgi:hypothetical protein
LSESHFHSFGEVPFLEVSAEPPLGKETSLYNDDGTVQKIQTYRDAAGTMLATVEIYSYDPDGILLSIRTDFYDDAGLVIVNTFTATVAYNADGSFASEVNA